MSDMLEQAKAAKSAADEVENLVKPASNSTTVHFVASGFTALGKVFLKNQELIVDHDDEAYELTLGVDGVSWLTMDEDTQIRRYGKVYFKPGPWPGERDVKDPDAHKKLVVAPRI